MKLDQVRTIANSRGIHLGKLSKAALIKSIQVDEGNLACFATAACNVCNQTDCLWREDCINTAHKEDAS